MSTNAHRFAIGTKFATRGKRTTYCTVIDQLTVTNSQGEIVKRYYHATHEFMGQTVTDYDVCDTTIARGQLQSHEAINTVK